jgi:hemoglobin
MRESVYDAAGGAAAFQRLAAAHHARCLADPLLEHPFSHGTKPDHVERLAAYWGEVLGGPAEFSTRYGGHPDMLLIHAECEAPPEMGEKFLECFVAAAGDARLPGDPRLRAVLRDYMAWAVDEVMAYAPKGSVVPDALAVPHWSWEGLVGSR